MPNLMERIQADMKDAMRAHEQERVGVLRMLLSRLKDAQIQKGGARAPLGDEEALAVLASYAKQRREAAESFAKAGRPDLAEKEGRERDLVLAYMPAQLGDEEIRTALREVIAETGAASPKDLGRVMGAAMQRLKGKADGTRVQALARELLGV